MTTAQTSVDRLLIIAAHPDDEILGAGGTSARLAEQGWDSLTLILGEGITSRAPDRQTGLADSADELQALRGASELANRTVGTRQLLLRQLPDNRFDTVALLDVVKIVSGVIADFEPTVVFTHHPGDLNIDHGVTFRATLTALRPLPEVRVPELYCFEVPSSTEYGAPALGRPFQPNTFFPITEEHLNAKLAAMEAYESEARAFPHPRSKQALVALAKWRGAQCGHPRAEAFELIRCVRAGFTSRL